MPTATPAAPACNQITASAVLTVIVSFDCADQAEELDDPTEPLLHLKHKHTRQDLEHTHIREESGGGRGRRRRTGEVSYAYR